MGLRVSSGGKAGSHRTYTEPDVALLRRAVYLRRVQGLNAPGILDQLRREGLVDAQAFASTNAHPIGKRLRTLRLSQKKSLAEVALAVGVSVGFLSNLERSQTGASIGIIHRLAQYYDSNILDFFSRTAPSGPLVRARDRQTLHGWDGVRMDLLAWGDTVMEPHLFHIEPGCGSKEVWSEVTASTLKARSSIAGSIPANASQPCSGSTHRPRSDAPVLANATHARLARPFVTVWLSGCATLSLT
jgi:transcriptional regulator with XRE-family HTH domain